MCDVGTVMIVFNEAYFRCLIGYGRKPRTLASTQIYHIYIINKSDRINHIISSLIKKIL